MQSRRLWLRVLCEDSLHRGFVERLADRWQVGPRQRSIDAAPAAHGSAAKYVLDHFVEFVRLWRSHTHDENVGALVMIDGDERGMPRRRQERTRYKAADPQGRDVGRLIEDGSYSPRLAVRSWTPPDADEGSHVPSLADARQELRRLGVAV